MDNNNLKHHGVKGMKWGVRRSSLKTVSTEQLKRTKNTIDTTSDIVKESKNITKSIGNIRSTSKKKNLSSMSDAELREKVNRMNLEQQYSMLSSNQTSKGHAYVTNTLEIAGSALAIASSAVAIAVGIRTLKG